MDGDDIGDMAGVIMEKREWMVRMRCVVIKDVVTRSCTADQAWSDPWEFAEDETEVEQVDWDIIDFRPNE